MRRRCRTDPAGHRLPRGARAAGENRAAESARLAQKSAGWGDTTKSGKKKKNLKKIVALLKVLLVGFSENRVKNKPHANEKKKKKTKQHPGTREPAGSSELLKTRESLSRQPSSLSASPSRCLRAPGHLLPHAARVGPAPSSFHRGYCLLVPPLFSPPLCPRRQTQT